MTNSAKHTNDDKDTAAKADREARRAGQQSKMASIKAILAATDLGDAAKLVGVTAALHFGYSKGVIRAEHKTLGARCNKTARGVEKAALELVQQRYWDVERTPGRANVYSLIHPDHRPALWATAEREWRRQCNSWRDAEAQWERDCDRWCEVEQQHQWLDAESRVRDEFADKFVAIVLELDPDSDRDITRDIAVNTTWEHRDKWNATIDAALNSVRSKIGEMDRETFLRQFNPDGHRKFLDAREEFKKAVHRAAFTRFGDHPLATRMADHVWDRGLTVEQALLAIAEMPPADLSFPTPEDEAAAEPAPQAVGTSTPQGGGTTPRVWGVVHPRVRGITPQVWGVPP